MLEKTLSFLPNPGLLLAVSSPSGKRNVMTIGWATFGIVWNRLTCTIMVRPTRYTYNLIEESDAFTVNVPAPGMEGIQAFCGCNSGREVDKIGVLGLSFSPSKTVNSISLDSCILTYECRIIGKCDISPDMLTKDILIDHYTMGTREANYHRVYLSEIIIIQRRDTS